MHVEKQVAERLGNLQRAKARAGKQLLRVQSSSTGVRSHLLLLLILLLLLVSQDMAAFQMRALQRQLDESVPGADLEAANKQFNELTDKYREMLDRGNTLVLRSKNLEHLEVPLPIQIPVPVPEPLPIPIARTRTLYADY